MVARQRQYQCMVLLTFFLLAFWAVPVVLISSLMSLGSLEEYMPFLVPFLEEPAVSNFVQGTLPSFLLIGLMSMLPYLLLVVAYKALLFSEQKVTEFVVQWYYVFLIVNVFLVSLISGSLISSVKVWINVSSLGRGEDCQRMLV